MAYVQANFNCITQEIVNPDKPIPFPDLNLPTPDPDSNDDLPDEDGPYDEYQRKPPDSYRDWWYHSDHLGSSTYLTDNFGRPSHYYETLPFGEMIVEHNQSSFYDNKYKFNGKELDNVTQMYYYGARYYDPRISIFVSVDPLAEQTMEPYLYTGNNPIMFTDPTGMSAENGAGGGFWNKLKSFIGISSTEKPTQYADDGSEILDEVVVSANRKPSFWNRLGRSFSRNKISNDWKNIKENSGYNHAANYVEDNRENISNAWNSPASRAVVPDKVGASLSSSATAFIGLNVGLNIDWITRGHDASIIPYMTFTVGGQGGANVSADALFGVGAGYYPVADMRSLQKGQASRDLLGWSLYGSANAGAGVGGSITGSVGFQKQPLISRSTWLSGNFSVGAAIGGGGVGGVSFTVPVFSEQFK